MATPDEATQTQIRNLEARYGKPFDALVSEARAAGGRHSEIVKRLKAGGMGHGDANLVAHHALAAAEPAPAEAPADAWYAGPKAALRPIHDRVLAIVAGFGGEVEHAPKKTYLSLRRKKQLATVGPATKTEVEIGLNLKGAPGDDRVTALPPGGMCTHRIRVRSVEEVDERVVDWLRRAWEAAGS